MLLINEGLLKRKAFLDSFLDGLDTFQFRKLIQSNPKLFEPMFVNNKRISAEGVKKIISTDVQPASDVTKLRILHTIGVFLDECSEEGKPLVYAYSYST